MRGGGGGEQERKKKEKKEKRQKDLEADRTQSNGKCSIYTYQAEIVVEVE